MQAHEVFLINSRYSYNTDVSIGVFGFCINAGSETRKLRFARVFLFCSLYVANNKLAKNLLLPLATRKRYRRESSYTRNILRQL